MAKPNLNQALQDPSYLVNQILNNNPTAVAQNAIAEGLFTYQAPPEELAQAISDLLRQGNVEAVLRLINVPYVPNTGNETDQWAEVFIGRRAVNKSASKDNQDLQALGSSAAASAGEDNSNQDFWLSLGLGAITGALTAWSQNLSGSATNPSAPKPGSNSPQNNGGGSSNSGSSNNLTYIILGVFGFVVVVIVGVILYKSLK